MQQKIITSRISRPQDVRVALLSDANSSPSGKQLTADISQHPQWGPGYEFLVIKWVQYWQLSIVSAQIRHSLIKCLRMHGCFTVEGFTTSNPKSSKLKSQTRKWLLKRIPNISSCWHCTNYAGKRSCSPVVIILAKFGDRKKSRNDCCNESDRSRNDWPPADI